MVEFKDQIEQALGVLTDENAVCKNFFSKECQDKVGASLSPADSPPSAPGSHRSTP